jgi:hypothetical protein
MPSPNQTARNCVNWHAQITQRNILGHMVIQKPGRGRPSRQFIVDQGDLGMCDLARTGGLAAPVENQQIWRDIGREIGAGGVLATTFRLDRTFGVDRVATMLLDRLVDLLVAPFQVLTPGAGWLPPTLQS